MKKILSITLSIILLFSLSTVTFATETSITPDLDNGVVQLQVANLTSSKTLVLIEKEGIRYSYPITSVKATSFPLQLGNGEYTVRLMENTTGNKYKELTRTTLKLSLEDSNDVFLNSIQDINWSSNKALILKASSLTEKLTTDEQKVRAIYTYITQNYKYDYEKAKTVQAGYFPDVNQIFKSQKGICYDFSAVFASMTRSLGIPTKLIKGYSSNTGDVYHAWNEVYINNQWKVIDTTVDAAIIKASKKTTLFKSSSDYKTEKIY